MKVLLKRRIDKEKDVLNTTKGEEEMKEVSKESGAKRKKSLPRKSTRGTVKRQKMEEETEKEDLKGYLDIVPREVAEDVESLSTKYPIVDWKTCVLTENFMYYQIFRGDGSSKNYKVLSEMLEDFDRQDVMDLYRLVKERYSASRPEGYDLMLWGDLHTLFEPDEEDEIWKNQHEYNVISWSLYDFCGIHILLMQNGIAIHMLTEKKYPLSQETITKMLNKRLEVDHESSQAFELLSTNGVSTASTYLVLPELVNTARRKINTADGCEELDKIRFSISRNGHRRSQSALDQREVAPPDTLAIETTSVAGVMSTSHHGIEVAVEFKPVEHPTEPLDIDQPIQCPLPEPSILNDGRIWKERVSAGVHTRADIIQEETGAPPQPETPKMKSRPRTNHMILPSISAPEHNILKLLEESGM
ncbi:hypothetical protein Tco_0173735 [Tanacetum coccineum]